MKIKKRYIGLIGFLTVLVLLGIVYRDTLSYLCQAFSGHSRIMRSRIPIKDKLREKDLSADTITKLNLVLEVRSYASEKLGLPSNKSYTVYSEIDSQFVGWNVYAAPHFSVDPKKWCFPIAGCIVYRGYFSKEKALEFAGTLSKKDLDVFVGPFNDYSTLGWYDDPVLSSHLRLPPVRLASLIIHELAHQEFYLSGDSRFNEAFAVTVERAGVLRWLESKNRNDLVVEAERMWGEEDLIVAKILRARAQLMALYNSGLDSISLEQKRSAIFQDLKRDLCGASCAGVNLPKTSGQEDLELNNAYLVPIDTYYSLLPVFKKILDSVGGDLPHFYERVRELGKLPANQRQREIESLQKDQGMKKAVSGAGIAATKLALKNFVAALDSMALVR